MFGVLALIGVSKAGDPGRWQLMWSLAVVMYLLSKLSVAVVARDVGGVWYRWMAFLLAWPGMDARQFVSGTVVAAERPSIGEWLFAVFKCGFGLSLVAVGAHYSADRRLAFWTGWTGMVGVVFTLHFGLFHLLSCGWRRLGVAAIPLMDWPICSTSVAEFWGRRWNRGFRDLTHQLLFKPMNRRWGPRWSSRLCFVASGLIHELAITVPAGSGFGGPTLYFLAQGMALEFERTARGRRLGLTRGWTGWLFALLVVAGPVGLLFPRAFAVEVIVAMLRWIAAG